MTAVAPKGDKKAKRGQPCTVCRHPRRGEIDRAIVEGQSAPRVAAHYRGISDDAVRRHASTHLPASLALAADVRATAGANSTFEQLGRCVERVNLLMDACDDWLRDPEDPSRYDVSPRTEEVQVVYVEEDSEGKKVRKKASLGALLKKVRGEAPDVRLVETRHADPRELVLNTVRRVEGLAELLARIRGELKDPLVLNLTVNAEWLSLQGTIVTALAPFPQARAAVLAALEEHGVVAA